MALRRRACPNERGEHGAPAAIRAFALYSLAGNTRVVGTSRIVGYYGVVGEVRPACRPRLPEWTQRTRRSSRLIARKQHL
jgi:hypothetical protein